MADINKFKIKYTELVGEDKEIEGEMVIETKNITWSLEQFMRNRHIIKIDTKQIIIK